MLNGKKILLGVTGGIAAFKAADLASQLTKAGAVVKTILTANACKMIAPLTFAAVTRQSVHTEMFDPREPIAHIDLADWADALIIAPASANIIAKAAQGIADDLLSTVILAMHTPVVIIPAMNVHMYENAATTTNLKILSGRGMRVLEPDTGRLACGYEGKGRFPAVSEIALFLRGCLDHTRDFSGKKILITTGACREFLDPMRFISNLSSGETGISLARAAAIRGAEVVLVHAHVDAPIPHYLNRVMAESAEAMREAVMSRREGMDAVIMTAAVTDYTFAHPSTEKQKKTGTIDLSLKPTRDILKELGETKTPGQYLIGFAAETDAIEANALDKLRRKHLDLIVANHIRVAGQVDTQVTVLDGQTALPFAGDKFDAANFILDCVLERIKRA